MSDEASEEEIEGETTLQEAEVPEEADTAETIEKVLAQRRGKKGGRFSFIFDYCFSFSLTLYISFGKSSVNKVFANI